MIDTAQHKNRLKDYFDGVGFERWSAIYGQAELSRIRRTIRDGHARMLAQAERWLLEALGERRAGSAPHVLDAGCGTGLFSTALAVQGFSVTAVDIAPQMVAAAEANARSAGVQDQISFANSDLEQISGSYDAVVCFDVLIHYPLPLFAQLCTRLAGLSRGPLLLTYAPHNPLLAGLHWMGGRFPHHHRRTDIQMIPDRFVHQTLEAAGMQARRSVRISRGFYHVTLLEATA